MDEKMWAAKEEWLESYKKMEQIVDGAVKEESYLILRENEVIPEGISLHSTPAADCWAYKQGSMVWKLRIERETGHKYFEVQRGIQDAPEDQALGSV